MFLSGFQMSALNVHLWPSAPALLQSAEALCLQACRGFEPAPNPPNLQNLKQAHKGEGLPSPYPLPDGPARSAPVSL